jgi:hypothetical protein
MGNWVTMNIWRKTQYHGVRLWVSQSVSQSVSRRTKMITFWRTIGNGNFANHQRSAEERNYLITSRYNFRPNAIRPLRTESLSGSTWFMMLFSLLFCPYSAYNTCHIFWCLSLICLMNLETFHPRRVSKLLSYMFYLKLQRRRSEKRIKFTFQFVQNEPVTKIIDKKRNI